MRIMIDANVIYSALYSPNSIIANMVEFIKQHHTLVLCQYVLDEADAAFKEKRPTLHESFLLRLYRLPEEIYNLTDIDTEKYPKIRDFKDIPVIAHVIESQVDIFITGDKDFDEVNITKPQIMKPRQFIDAYIK